MSPHSVSRLRALACALAACALLASCTGASSSPRGLGIVEGVNVVTFERAQRKSAPSFAGESLKAGPEVTSASLAGAVAVVNFWGSWCGPCRREQPMLETLAKSYAARGVRFVGISTRDQRAAALRYLDEFSVTYPSIYDPDAALSFKFKLQHMPGSYVIDRDGKIAAEIVGALEKPGDLTAILDKEIA
jgi:thiol-disulfide isomerase/thioredoxin